MIDLDKIIEILSRKSTIPNDGESFHEIDRAFDDAISCLCSITQIKQDIQNSINNSTNEDIIEGLNIALNIINSYIDFNDD